MIHLYSLGRNLKFYRYNYWAILTVSVSWVWKKLFLTMNKLMMLFKCNVIMLILYKLHSESWLFLVHYHLCYHVIILSISLFIQSCTQQQWVWIKNRKGPFLCYSLFSQIYYSVVYSEWYLNRKPCSYITTEIMFMTLNILMIIMISFYWCWLK